MTLPLIIVNPASAAGGTRDAWRRMASDLRTHFGPFELAFTTRRGDATSLATDAARRGAPMVVACGGDGTISETANGILLAGTDSELGILPSGTGGDFRRTLEIPTRTRDAALILRAGRTVAIDVGSVSFLNEDGARETRHFLGVASFGMSTDVIERVKEGGPAWLPERASRWLSGRLTFGASMLQTAIHSPAARVIVQLDDQHERRLRVTNFCVANARYFGGGMKIAPNATLVDGWFDVVTIGDLGSLKILANSPRIYFGSHLGMPEVSHAHARKILARPADAEKVIAIEVDGEVPGRLPATFQLLPKALRVRCPTWKAG
jgi:diacylglycerol kinase (ATP)